MGSSLRLNGTGQVLHRPTLDQGFSCSTVQGGRRRLRLQSIANNHKGSKTLKRMRGQLSSACCERNQLSD